MNGNRERLAWFILLMSFAMCAVVSVATPLLARSALQNATQPLTLALQVNEGTARVVNTLETIAVFEGDPSFVLVPQSTIETEANDTATILVYESETEELLLSRFQIYGDTSLNLTQASTPRFASISPTPNTLFLALSSGRLRMTVPENATRQFQIQVNTPHGVAVLGRGGQYLLEVTEDESHIIVHEGQAELASLETKLSLQLGERGVMVVGGIPAGPFTTERNLIRNSDFSEGLAHWTIFPWNIELPDQPSGSAEVAVMAGEPTLHYLRDGEGHADTTTRQLIDQDVRDLTALQLEINLRIANHTVGVCGSLGSECPLAVRVGYEDVNGNEQSWQQGFYAVGQAGAPGTPDICQLCPAFWPSHHQITLGQFAFYRIDLLNALSQSGLLLPSHIKDIQLLAAGHSFDVEVIDIALIAE